MIGDGGGGEARYWLTLIPSTLARPSVKKRSHSSFTKTRGLITEAKGCMGTMWMPWISSGAVPKYARGVRGELGLCCSRM